MIDYDDSDLCSLAHQQMMELKHEQELMSAEELQEQAYEIYVAENYYVDKEKLF